MKTNWTVVEAGGCSHVVEEATGRVVASLLRREDAVQIVAMRRLLIAFAEWPHNGHVLSSIQDSVREVTRALDGQEWSRTCDAL